MGRICGYQAAGTSALDLNRLLAGCCHGGDAHRAPIASHTCGNMALAADAECRLATSADGRYACVFDGLLFNRDELGRTLPQPAPAAALSDADTVLQTYISDGEQAFAKLRGQFALAIADGNRNELVLARDAFGVKSLFYAKTGNGIVFASSLAGIARAQWVNREIGMSGFLEYLACGYISAPWTIYEQVTALRAGEYMVTGTNGTVTRSHFSLEPETWGFSNTRGMSEDDLVEKLDRLVAAAVARRLPPAGNRIAAYLSGGLDTSLVCSTLREQAGRNIVAYTLGFRNRYYDETPNARAVAEHLGIEHHPYYISQDEFMETLHALPETYGQPFADISAIPTCVVAARVSEEFDTVFSGEGPDFLFGNFDLRLLYYYYKWIPYAMRRGLSHFSHFLAEKVIKRRTSPNLDIPELLRQRDLLWTFTRMFKSDDLELLTGEPVYEESIWTSRFIEGRKDIPLGERLRLAQYLCYGISDVLYKSGCAHTANGIELMCPCYDHDVFDFIQFLPTRYKFRKCYGKYLQKKLLYRKIPRHLLERPKRGFVMDFVEFGVEPIRALTDRYLNRARLAETGLFKPDFAVKCVEQYYAGDTNMGPKLWTLLMFEMWRAHTF